MKSKKAIKIIHDNTINTDGVKMDTTGYVGVAVSVGKAYAAVDLAEKEMKEKAMIAFCRASCGELCWDFDLDNKCDELEEFIELLDE